MIICPLEDKDTVIKIFESLGKIQGQLSGLDIIREKADNAHALASIAENQAKDNKEDINEIKTKHSITSKVAHEANELSKNNDKRMREISTNIKWFIGLNVPVLTTIVLWILGQILK